MINLFEKFFIKKRPVLGIDIGMKMIKLVELSPADKGAKGVKILHMGSIPTPEGALEEGMIRDKEKLESALMNLLSSSEAVSRDVILNITSKNLITRQLRLPMMPEKELQQAVEWETEKYVPIQKDSLHIDFINFGEILTGQNKQLNILVAAAPSDLITGFHELFSRIGLDIVAIEVVPLALWHGLAQDFKSENKLEATFILELGAHATTVVVYRNQKLYFTRSIPIGGNEIDKSISMILAVTEDEAKDFKEKHGITDPEEDVTGFPEDPAEKLQFAIKGTLRDLMQEVQRSINFYQVQDREAEINKIFVVGGLANMQNIGAYITKEVNLPVEIYSPAVQGEVTLNPAFITAYGLARREVE